MAVEILIRTAKPEYVGGDTLCGLVDSQRYLFNADTNYNANPTNPNRYSKGNHNPTNPNIRYRCK